MTPAESLKGATLYAAKALGLEELTGSLEPGKVADFAVMDASDFQNWLYHFRPNACRLTVARGQVVRRASDGPDQ
jgi:imidazolonepropionase